MKAIYLAHPRGISDRVIREVHAVAGLDLVVEEGWESMTSDRLADGIREFDILLLSRGLAISDSLADDPGRLQHICYLHGSIRQWIGLPILRSNITVTNWGDAPAVGLAMGSLVLLQASLLDLHKRIMAVRRGARRGFNSVGGTVTMPIPLVLNDNERPASTHTRPKACPFRRFEVDPDAPQATQLSCSSCVAAGAMLHDQRQARPRRLRRLEAVRRVVRRVLAAPMPSCGDSVRFVLVQRRRGKPNPNGLKTDLPLEADP